MDQTSRILQLIGTFLPVYGVVATIVAAVALKRGWRTAALILIPLLTLVLCSVFGEEIAYDGNLLYVSLASLYFAALSIYYPVLIVFGGLSWIRRHRKGG